MAISGLLEREIVKSKTDFILFTISLDIKSVVIRSIILEHLNSSFIAPNI